jgi:hypothetical protein
VVDLANDTEYVSENAPDQYVTLDFGERRVILTSYQLRSDTLRSWELRAGMSLDDLVVIDGQQNFGGFGQRNTHCFNLLKSPGKCRYVQLRQTGKNRENHDMLSLYALELFGFLRESGQ